VEPHFPPEPALGSERPIIQSTAPPETDISRPEPPTTAEQPTQTPTDLAEFSQFYRMKAGKLVAFLRWQGAPLPDATDCVQEALTRCFERWETIADPHAWCRRVASRLYSRRVATIEDPVDDLEAVSPSVLLRLDAKIDEFENRHVILQMIRKLPLRQRQVLAWTFDGAPDAEIADVLQISLDAVKATRHKARIALSRIAKDEGDER
jgi:RNA polymerase sigma factor (sigma-70 family)